MQRRVANQNRHCYAAVGARSPAGGASPAGITNTDGTDVLISTYQASVIGPAEESVEPSTLDAQADLPCRAHDPDLWFSDSPAQLDMAKAFCAECPARAGCLAGAIGRREPWGVWGGEIFQQGRIISHKRMPGRPRKHFAA